MSNIASLVAGIRSGYLPLGPTLAQLIIALNERPEACSIAQAFTEGSTTRRASVSNQAGERKAILVHTLRLRGTTVAANGTVNLTCGARTVTGGAVPRDALLAGAGGGPLKRPLLWEQSNQVILDITIAANTTAADLVLDGFMVSKEVAYQIHRMVGAHRVYSLRATVGQGAPQVPVQTGPFDTQDVYRSQDQSDGTTVRLYLGDRPNIFPQTMRGADVPLADDALPAPCPDMIRLGDQLRLEVPGLTGVQQLDVIVRGGEFYIR